MEIMNLSGGGGSVIKSRKSYSVESDNGAWATVNITPVNPNKSIIVVTSSVLLNYKVLTGSIFSAKYEVSFQNNGTQVLCKFETETLFNPIRNGQLIKFEVIEFN